MDLESRKLLFATKKPANVEKFASVRPKEAVIRYTINYGRMHFLK